ncbi:MAG: 4Fe-4S binding protein [Candidatus Omnitrophica bacterium]|nr:4Fe-4S binding protein [Candidatus Omnitrophota bacterium]
MDLQNIRAFIQWISLIGSNSYLGFLKTKQVYQGALKSSCVPFLNCHSCPSALFSCPIGTIQHFMTIHKFPYLVSGYLAAVGISVGALPCGWLCPFGLIQDLLYKINSVKIKIHEKLTVLRYYSLIFLVIFFPLMTQETWFSKICPMGTIQAAIPWVVWNPVIPVYGEPAVSLKTLGFLFIAKILIAFSFIGLFIISKRPFCRLICPLGAILGLFNRVSLLRLGVNTKDCKDCQKCRDICPVDINISDDPQASTCVRCFKCLHCENVKISLGKRSKKEEIATEAEELSRVK